MHSAFIKSISEKVRNLGICCTAIHYGLKLIKI